jgi:hypothetical protein
MTTIPIHTSSQSSTSVFDRLYSKSTESSRSRKSTAQKATENIDGNVSGSKVFNSKKNGAPRSHSRPALKSKTNVIHVQNNTGSSEVYNRLYSKGTASYNSKRKTTATQSVSKSTTTKRFRVSNSTLK